MAVSRAKPVDRAVDAWVRRELASRYGAVLDETVPPELIRLAGQVADRARGQG